METYKHFTNVQQDLWNAPCRFPRQFMTRDFRKFTLRCGSRWVLTCPSCALRRRSDERTLIIDGIEGYDPHSFLAITMTLNARTDESLVRHHYDLTTLETNFIATLRNQFGRSVAYWLAHETQKNGRLHVHMLVRKNKTWQVHHIERVKDALKTTSTTSTLSGEKLRFGRASVDMMSSQKDVTREAGYLQKLTMYRPKDQIHFKTYSELENLAASMVPALKRRNHASIGGFRGRQSRRSRNWTDLCLKALKKLRREAYKLARADSHEKDEGCQFHGIVPGWDEDQIDLFDLIEQRSDVLLALVTEVRASRRQEE